MSTESYYAKLIKQEVYTHDSCDAPFWPPIVSELVRSLQNELKIHSSLKSDSDPLIDERVIRLLGQLRSSEDASNVALWDDTVTDERHRTTYNTALLDCTRIRAVIETENLTGSPCPKESFLVVLVRNVMLNAHPQLFSLESVPVVLPRHFSGVAIPILKFMPKSFYAPLIVSVPQELSVQGSAGDLEHESNDGDDPGAPPAPPKHPSPTLSGWLNSCEQLETPEEVEGESGDDILPQQFDAHFLGPLPSAHAPSTCHIPVLCMADEEQFPVLMSSLLYQRRVWHIGDPLIGLRFSKYDTTVRVFLGWLEDNVSLGRVLPRVHLGQIGTPIKLDLSSPSAVLVLSRLLCGLGSHMFVDSVGAIVDTQPDLSLSWRIDTDTRKEDCAPPLENNDRVKRWLISQKDSEDDSQMPPRKTPSNVPGSATPTLLPQGSTKLSHKRSTISSVPSDFQAPRSQRSTPKSGSRSSCSDFAAGQNSDPRVFRWMFDRRVIPRSVPSDTVFCEEYSAMTCLIWPEEWNDRQNLPPVDTALEQCVGDLLKSIGELKNKPGAVKCIPEKQFPVDLRILTQSFSAIFQASHRSLEKKTLPELVNEMAWRHDHDRLLYDFFIRLSQPESDSIACLEDSLSRPILETTLRLPESDNMQINARRDLQNSIRSLLQQSDSQIHTWLGNQLEDNAASDAATLEMGYAAYVTSQFATWAHETNRETIFEAMTMLNGLPSTGKCDALGRLLVELPDASVGNLGRFPLVVRTKDGEDKRSKAKDSARRSDTLNASGSSRAIKHDKDRYNIVSSAYCTPTGKGSAESVGTLASALQGLGLGHKFLYLELPILTAEYKKASDNPFKGTNQLRMYLIASLKFLQAVGISNFTVYGVQTDGPIVVLPAAVLRDDNFIYLFERLVQRLDISTPLGAWHYATILCRLAGNHAEMLKGKFEQVKGNLVGGGVQTREWTIDHQRARLATPTAAGGVEE